MSERAKNESKAQRRAMMVERVSRRVDEKPYCLSISDADWATVTLPARQHVWRRMLELRDWYCKARDLPLGYLDDDLAFQVVEKVMAAELERLAAFDELAHSRGMTFSEMLEQYKRVEDGLRADPLKGFQVLCEMYGHDPITIAHALTEPVGHHVH